MSDAEIQLVMIDRCELAMKKALLHWDRYRRGWQDHSEVCSEMPARIKVDISDRCDALERICAELVLLTDMGIALACDKITAEIQEQDRKLRTESEDQ